MNLVEKNNINRMVFYWHGYGCPFVIGNPRQEVANTIGINEIDIAPLVPSTYATLEYDYVELNN